MTTSTLSSDGQKQKNDPELPTDIAPLELNMDVFPANATLQ